jgi:hypothetical protein
MKLVYLLAALIPSAFCIPAPFDTAQETLRDTSAKREKVVGQNPAYFFQVPEAKQLIEIGEFVVSPNPPIRYLNLTRTIMGTANTTERDQDTRVFFYMRCYVKYNLPGLENATLTLRSIFEGTGSENTQLINGHRAFPVRDRSKDRVYQYDRPLVKYANEIVGDFEILHWRGPDVLNFYIEAVAKLPDQRILFAFEADVDVEI